MKINLGKGQNKNVPKNTKCYTKNTNFYFYASILQVIEIHSHFRFEKSTNGKHGF